MNANIRLGKISSIDYAKGMARVVYHEKDDDVTRLIPLLSHEYKMPPVGVPGPGGPPVQRDGGRGGPGAAVERQERAAGGRGQPIPEGPGAKPGDAMIRYDGSTLTIKCTGAINIEAGGAITINGATIDLN